MTIILSAHISPDLTLEVRSAGLPGTAGGIALRFTLHDGPISFTLTNDEARRLIIQIQRQLATDADAPGVTP
jgi:hypothetical protein